jgi:hypothetical protein
MDVEKLIYSLAKSKKAAEEILTLMAVRERSIIKKLHTWLKK